MSFLSIIKKIVRSYLKEKIVFVQMPYPCIREKKVKLFRIVIIRLKINVSLKKVKTIKTALIYSNRYTFY